MPHQDTLLKKREDKPRLDPRNVNVMPALGLLGQHRQETNSKRADLPSPPERPKTDGVSVSRLIVGPDIKLKGVEIIDCDTLVVEGAVAATMNSRVLQIAEHGVFTGTASVDSADIRGCFDGELTVRDQLVIHATGRVSGKISYGRIKLEENAEISGDVSRLDTRAPGSVPPVLKAVRAAEILNAY